jgi:hypothetical protein
VVAAMAKCGATGGDLCQAPSQSAEGPGRQRRLIARINSTTRAPRMSDLDRLKKENKQLKLLLKKAVALLNKYKPVLQQVEALDGGDKDNKDKGNKDNKDKKEKKKKKKAKA